MIPGLLIPLSAAIGYALIFGGGVNESHWLVCQAIVGATALAAPFLTKARLRPRPLDRRAVWLFTGLFAFLLLQVTPLPAALVAVLSPSRAELSRALSIAGPSPDWVTLSVEPGATLRTATRWAAAAVVFILVRAAAARLGRENWWSVAPLAGLACAEAVLGLVQLAAGAPVQGTSGNRNHFAAALNLAMPFALAAGASRALTPALGLAALLAAAAALSLSRMGFLALLAGGAVTSWRALSHRLRPAMAGLVLAGLLPAAFALAPGGLIERFSGGDDRLTLWRETLGLVREYPVFGCGLGTYESAFQSFKRMAPDRTADYAHNDFLQFAAELGLVGFGILLTGMYFLLRPVLGRQRGWFRQACLASLTAAALHSLTDYPLYIPANLLLFSWVAGVSSLGPSKEQADILPTEV